MALGIETTMNQKKKKRPVSFPASAGPPSAPVDGPHPHLKATAWTNPVTNPYGKQSESPMDTWRGKPVSPQMPQEVVDARAGGARWNAGLANNGWSSAYADSPGGQREIHPSSRLNGFLRPRGGGVPSSDATSGHGFSNPFAANPGAPASPNGPALTPTQVDSRMDAGTWPKIVNPVTATPGARVAPAPDAGAGHATRFGGSRITNPNGSTTTVFSDGSNGIPRTVSADQIKAAAGALNIVPASALTNPLAGDVAGHPVSTNDMVNQRVANMPQQATPLVNPAFRQMAAADDAASVATGDWRSPLGTAAHNLRVEAGSGTTRNRRMAEDAMKQLQLGVQQRAITGANEAGANQRNAMAQAGQTQRTGMQETGANMRTGAQQRGASARMAAQLSQPVQVALPGNLLGIMNPRTGAITPVQYNGKAVQSVKPTAAHAHTQKLVDQLRSDASKALAARQKNQLPGEDGKVVAPKPEDMRQIMMNQAYVQGYAPQINPKTGQIALTINGQQVLL